MRTLVGGAEAPLHRVERGSAHLAARELRKGFGEGTVLDGVSLTVSAGQCLAVVGDNGVGKSTLLRLLAGTLRPDAGSVMCTTTRTLVEQELTIAAGSTVADVRAAATRSARAALLALEDASVALADDHPDAAERYAAALADAERLDAWNAQRCLAEALDAFGATFPRHARLHELSVGGDTTCDWRVRCLIRRGRSCSTNPVTISTTGHSTTSPNACMRSPASSCW